jgi:endogenous inhibitor of DNA gyrase (YacG/DUF329 family)
MSERPPESRPRCAMCGKPQDEKFKPFCSKRCADLDLGKWLKGSYSLPGEAPVDLDEMPDDTE